MIPGSSALFGLGPSLRIGADIAGALKEGGARAAAADPTMAMRYE